MRFSVRARTADDSGITLVEVLVALVIATGVFLALAMASITGVKGLLLARQSQLAGDMLNQAVEKVRALDFADVALVTGDSTLAADPRISSGKFDPGTGAESVVYVAAGSLNPHVTTETHNNTTFDVYRYVTQPTAIPGSRRLTVVVVWTSQGSTHTRQETTLVTATRRGLPLPRFLAQFSSPSSQTLGAGTPATFGLRIKNYGARDAWNINGPSSGTWSYVVDTNKDGVLESNETTALTDTNNDGIVDTGPLEVNAELFLLATTTTPVTVGSTTSYSWTLTSVAQPLAATASQTLTGQLTTATPPASLASCAVVNACTLNTGYLHEAAGSHPTSSVPSRWDFTSNTLQSTLFNYSTEVAVGTAGRYLVRGGDVTSSSDKTVVAEWAYQATKKTQIAAGQAVVSLYVACPAGASAPETLTAGIADLTLPRNGTLGYGSVVTPPMYTGSATLTECNGEFRLLQIPVPIPANVPVANNDYIVIRVAVPAGQPYDVRLAYDYTGAVGKVVIPQ